MTEIFQFMQWLIRVRWIMHCYLANKEVTPTNWICWKMSMCFPSKIKLLKRCTFLVKTFQRFLLSQLGWIDKCSVIWYLLPVHISFFTYFYYWIIFLTDIISFHMIFVEPYIVKIQLSRNLACMTSTAIFEKVFSKIISFIWI